MMVMKIKKLFIQSNYKKKGRGTVTFGLSTMTLNTCQMLILLLFNFHSSLNTNDIHRETNLPLEILEKFLSVLTKRSILQQKSDSYSLNPKFGKRSRFDFTSRKRVVNVQISKEDRDNIEAERKYLYPFFYLFFFNQFIFFNRLFLQSRVN